MGNERKNKYIGVVFDLKTRKYDVIIMINAKRLSIGTFVNEIEAAKAYDEAAVSFGKNKRLNFPEPEPENTIQNTKLISLTQGLFAVVDDIDFERVNQFKWCAKRGGSSVYAMHRYNNENKNIMLHRFILNLSDCDMPVDHIDGNGLNNTRENLRICTTRQNCCNQKKAIGKSSIYKGVSLNKRANRYTSQIISNRNRIHLGYFETELEGAIAYDMAAKELFGEYAKLNFNK